MYTLITNVNANIWEHDLDAESVDIDLFDTGMLVTVLEWVGTAYSSGEQQEMHNCTLYTDGTNYYTNFDGEYA